MAVLIEAIGVDRLAEYASVPMVCDVRSKMVVEHIGSGSGGELAERAVEIPYIKDYDSSDGLSRMRGAAGGDYVGMAT
jgi:hypothetical protein